MDSHCRAPGRTRKTGTAKLFTLKEGRMGVVVSFLALMELTRERLVDLVQNEPMGQIYVKSPSHED